MLTKRQLLSGASVVAIASAQRSAAQCQPLPQSYPGNSVLPPVTMDLQNSFDVAVNGASIAYDFVFGTGVTPTGNQIAITNLSQLATYFNPNQDFTQGITVNSELERYPTNFNSATCQFASDRMNLVASIDTSLGYSGAYASTAFQIGGTNVPLDGATSIPIGNLGWSNTTGLSIGQIVMFEYYGYYYVKSFVANTSVVLGPCAGSGTQNLTYTMNIIIPWFALISASSNTDPSSTITLTYMPAGVTTGMTVGFALGGSQQFYRTADHRITNISGNTITVSPALAGYGTLASGTVFFIGPPIVSGQIWSIPYFDLAREGGMYGFDLRCVMPSDSAGGYNLNGIGSTSALAAAPANAAWGAWPAFWVYSVQRDNAAYQSDTSELDFVEIFYQAVSGPWGIVGTNIGPLGNTNMFFLSSQGWTNNSGFNQSTTALNTGATQRFSAIVVPGQTFRYYNNVLTRRDIANWTSQHQAAIGVNLAVGALQAGYGANMLMPLQAANFPMKVGIQRLTVYKNP